MPEENGSNDKKKCSTSHAIFSQNGQTVASQINIAGVDSRLNKPSTSRYHAAAPRVFISYSRKDSEAYLHQITTSLSCLILPKVKKLPAFSRMQRLEAQPLRLAVN